MNSSFVQPLCPGFEYKYAFIGSSGTLSFSISNISEIQHLTGDKLEELLNKALRLNHKFKGMVTTYTYAPGVGLTSTTDTKGYTSYYEYDASNRLQFVKDAEGNILSSTNYNYKN